jgi:hypothetical protein
MPEHLERKRLAVVHVALGGIVPENTVDHWLKSERGDANKIEILTDLLLILTEPTILAAEFASRLCGRGWQVEPRDDTNKTCQRAFERKEPPLEIISTSIHVAPR